MRDDGIALRIPLALGVGTIELFVVRERVRVGPDDVCVNERWAVAVAAVLGGSLEGRVAGDGIGAVDFFEVKLGKFATSLRDASAGGLHFDRNGDRVAIVFDEEKYWQLVVGRRRSSPPRIHLRWWCRRR